MSHSVALWISVVLLLGNAFLVGAEFSAMAARRSTLEPLAEAGSARARICLDALEQMGSLLVTAQLGITVCSVGLGALAEAALHEILEGLFDAWDVQGRFGLSDAWTSPIALVLALLVVVYLHVVVGEMIPKNLAIAGPDRAALGRVPDVGDELSIPGWTLRVSRMDGRRVDRIRFVPTPATAADLPSDGGSGR